MPGHEGKIVTRCPACGANYRVPAEGVGQRARCAQCRSSFRVAEVKPNRKPSDLHHPPTEEDIVRWLNEGSDEEFLAARPRIVSGRDSAHPESHEDSPTAQPAAPPVESRIPRSDPILDPAAAAPGTPLRRTG